MPTVTYTLNIVDINPIGNNVWQLEFNPNSSLLGNVEDDPLTYLSCSSPVILNPFLNNIGNFNNSDYNAIINNAIPNRLSEWYQQIDYATDQNTPVNFQQLISGTAAPASVQDSNYTSYQYSGIRYWGSKNTTDNFNSPLTITSSIVQTYQNDNLGLTTLGYASVNRLDANILEFNWGGGTYPEIYGGGALSLNQILGVGATRDSVSRFSSTENGFLGSVDILFPINSLPVFNQYTTTVNTAVNARVSSIGFTVPAVSNYMIASPTVVTTAEISASTNYITITGDLSEVNTNSAGNYITGSLINSSSFLASINQGFTSGERWFVTFYQNLPSPVVGVLEPLDLGYTNYTVENGYSYPLAAKGVFEITSSQNGAYISPVLPTSSFNASFGSSPINGGISFNFGSNVGPVASSVTNLYISYEDDNQNNLSSILEALNSSQTITLENTTAATGPFVYDITGNSVYVSNINGDYYIIPVLWISGGGNLRISDGVSFDAYDVYTDGNTRLFLDLPNGAFTTGSQFGNGKNGMLVWKSQGGAYMTFNDATLSGLGKGSLVTSTPTPVIEQDFTYITQEYGTNPKNQ
jgi:hypothetical protein